MAYVAPVEELVFTLRHVAGLDEARREGWAGELDEDALRALLEEAGGFAAGRLAPLDRVGDRDGARFEGGTVRMPPGFREAYQDWVAGGWNAVTAPERWGGAGLPLMLGTALMEIWTSANMAFALGPVLTQSAAEVLEASAPPALREAWLPKLVTGEWTATMNLTEPQAGSDLGALTTKAEPAGDGAYRLSGQKIYITYGEHDLADNIVHLVLARLPGAPAGTRGISLFLVPKVLPDGARNALRCGGIEHKLGIHASPTCTMLFEGALGWRIGEAHQGLAAMFRMMNRARLATGVQGPAIAEVALQQARAFAQERRQGRGGDADPGARRALGEMAAGQSVPIAAHPDVRRMLGEMAALTAAGRGILCTTAAAIDRAERGGDPAAEARAALLTPVAKAVGSEIGVAVADLNIQVHGGMGYVEETGAAQRLRDARIVPIYEGTNGIQAIDFLARKVLRDGGETARAELARIRAAGEAAAAENAPGFDRIGRRVREAADHFDRAMGWMLDGGRGEAERLAVATPFLRLFGLALGGGCLARGAVAALREEANPAAAGMIAAARFHAGQVLPGAAGLAAAVTEGAGEVLAA